MTKRAKPRALITGVTGQDGSYLAEFLLDKGYAVSGVARRSTHFSLGRVEHLLPRLKIVPGDLLDQSSVDELIKTIRPDEVYNLAAQSFVPTSWEQPIFTSEVDALGATRVLEAIRRHKPDARFYQASSSEMFGRATEFPQNEKTRFMPRSPYAVSKVYAHFITINYRESYGLFAVSGICFNHESPRRGLEFVTRKVTNAVARIRLGLQQDLPLGTLDVWRDWGFAGDYVEAMWRMLQQPKPDDFVIATGKTHTVREWVEEAFACAGLDWKRYVRRDKAFLRPADVPKLHGDASKARRVLKWKPRVDFHGLVKMMVQADMERASREAQRT
ncbi:MAG: GDP-mannose 4,6-dehydratase [Elusimicrobia bacterium]|nr:GDP-mannose 4,6-dehydratase [Elusimicrobiota bacterium]